jgi:hypothetical protein
MSTCQTTPTTVNEFDISGLEAMLAGTICLMSAYSHCQCGGENNQGLIGLKIVSNLTCLQYQNSLSPEFRRVLSKVCDSWRQHSLSSLNGSAVSNTASSSPLWLPTPDFVQ